MLLVLDAMQALFSDNSCPFVVILAIDPHIIAKVKFPWGLGYTFKCDLNQSLNDAVFF